MDADALVTGAGVRGLTTAICLAEAGRPVRVVARDCRTTRRPRSRSGCCSWSRSTCGPCGTTPRWRPGSRCFPCSCRSLLAPAAGRVTARFGPRPPMVAGLVLAAVGFGALTGSHADSSSWVLLPALLLWGLWLAALTPAVVAAAVASAGSRSGLASAVTSTARQAGGAVAGSASNARAFVSGLHLSGLVAAVLFLVAGLSTALMRSN